MRTNSWRERAWGKDPDTKRRIERVLADSTFVPGPWDGGGASRPCPMAPDVQAAWPTTMTWLVADPDGGGRDWVLWSYRISIGRWLRSPIRDTSEVDASRMTRWIDDWEFNDVNDRLAGRLGTYWADA